MTPNVEASEAEEAEALAKSSGTSDEPNLPYDADLEFKYHPRLCVKARRCRLTPPSG